MVLASSPDFLQVDAFLGRMHAAILTLTFHDSSSFYSLRDFFFFSFKH